MKAPKKKETHNLPVELVGEGQSDHHHLGLCKRHKTKAARSHSGQVFHHDTVNHLSKVHEVRFEFNGGGITTESTNENLPARFFFRNSETMNTAEVLFDNKLYLSSIS